MQLVVLAGAGAIGATLAGGHGREILVGVVLAMSLRYALRPLPIEPLILSPILLAIAWIMIRLAIAILIGFAVGVVTIARRLTALTVAYFAFCRTAPELPPIASILDQANAIASDARYRILGSTEPAGDA